MEILIGLAVSIANNIIKFAVARYGTAAVQGALLVLTAIAYYFWDTYGGSVNWQAYIEILGSSMVWYELIVKRLWPDATTKAIQANQK